MKALGKGKNPSKKGKPTEDDRLSATRKKIEKQFNFARNERFTLSAKKQRNKKKNLDSSYANYAKKLITIANKYKKKYGVGDITKFEKEKVTEILKEYQNPYTMSAMIKAVNFFQKTTEKGGSFRKPLNLVDRKEFHEYMQEENIIRRSGETLTAKFTKEVLENTIQLLESYGHQRASVAAEVLRFSSITGARFDGVMECIGEDITKNEDGSVTVHLHEKGESDRWVRIHEQHKVEYLLKKKESLSNQRQTILEPVRVLKGSSKGNRMNEDDTQKVISKWIKKSTDELGLNDGKQSYSAHSSRKLYVQEQVNSYAALSFSQLDNELEERYIENDRRRDEMKGKGISIPNLRQKYAKMVENINWINKSEGIRRTKVNREPNHKELVLFLASLDSGHYRIDVVEAYYAKYPLKKMPKR